MDTMDRSRNTHRRSCLEHRESPSRKRLNRARPNPSRRLKVPTVYKIQPSELMCGTSHMLKCPGCREVFEEMGGRKDSEQS
jgi:hypothetical protein